MGILDDAIREHLELKRLHGADPTEIDRLEREALGPVRRAPEDLDDARLGGQEPSGAEPPYDRADEGWDESSGEGAQTTHLHVVTDEDADEPLEEDEPFSGQERAAGPAGADAAEEPPSPGAHDPPPSHAPPGAGQETVQYDIEHDAEHEHEHERSDAIEETPEFLEEAPDHDRLWFEQRPPRDVDFDR